MDTGKNDIEIKDISVHETTSFSCPINSQPKSEIKWLFNSIPISLGEFYKVFLNCDMLDTLLFLLFSMSGKEL